MRKYLLCFIGIIILLLGCNSVDKEILTNSSTIVSQIEIQDINDIVPISEEIIKDQEITVKSYVININSGEKINTDSLFEEVPNYNMLFGDNLYASNYQYYIDRLIVGCQGCGGKSYVYRLDDNHHLSIDTVNYNIIYFDEAKEVYMAQNQEGYLLLDESYQITDSYPVLTDEKINNENQENAMFQLKAFGLQDIYYIGEYNGKPYQLMRYDTEKKQLILIYDLIELLNQQGILLGEAAQVNPKVTYYKNGEQTYLTLLMNKAWNGRDNFTLINKIMMISTKDNSIIIEDAYDEAEVAYPQPDFSYNVMQSSDKISLFRVENNKIVRIKDYYAEDIINDGENHINDLYRINDETIIMNVPTGVMKYDIKTGTSQQLYIRRIEE